MVFIVSSFVGVAPGMAVYVYIGSLSRDISSAWSSGSGSKWKDIMYLALIVVTTVAIIGLVTYIAKRELKKAMALLDEQEREEAAKKQNEAQDQDQEQVQVDLEGEESRQDPIMSVDDSGCVIVIDVQDK